MDGQTIDRNIAAAAWFVSVDFQGVERLLAPRDCDEPNMKSTKLRLYAYLYLVFAHKREVSDEQAEALAKDLEIAQEILKTRNKNGVIHNESFRMTEVWKGGEKIGEIMDSSSVAAHKSFWDRMLLAYQTTTPTP